MKIRQENIENFYPTMLKWADAHMFALPDRTLMPWDIFVLSDDEGVDKYLPVHDMLLPIHRFTIKPIIEFFVDKNVFNLH